MASSAVPANPTAHHVALLLPKLYDADSDFRYMALNDLHQIFNVAHPSFLQHDYNICAKTIDGLLHTLRDTNGDVQNMAIKCLGPFVNKIPDNILCPMIEKVSTLQMENIVDNSIRALALRTIVVSLPRPVPGIPRSKQVQDAYNAISKVLMPRFVGYTVVPHGRKDLPAPPKGLLEEDMENGADSNAMDVLIEVARCFGPMLQEAEVQALQKVTLEIIEHEETSTVLKKKAVAAISTLSTHFTDGLLSSFISSIIERMRDVHLTNGKRKLYITILGSIARTIPRKFGPYLKTLAPFVLSALSESELEEEMEAAGDEERDPEIPEVREAALVALDAFLGSCAQDMRPYTNESIDAALRFVNYDPNLANDDDDDAFDNEDDDALEGEDFEEEQGYDEEDDASWKVRRCAAKVLYTITSTRSSGDLLDDGTLYDKVAPALVARFKEREESVRSEVLAALSLLVRNTGSGPSASRVTSMESPTLGSMGPPPSRKRRRGGSDASMFDISSSLSLPTGLTSYENGSTPTSGPQASLAKLSPDIVRGVSQLLRNSSISTKQASIGLLRDILVAQHGGLSDYLGQIMDPVIEAVKTSTLYGIGSSSAAANSYRIQALQFLGATLESHPSKVLQPYLPKLVPALMAAAREKYSKVSVEALSCIEQLINASTPPRTASVDKPAQDQLNNVFELILNRISANDADLEVRQQAIHALGLFLARTSGSSDLLSPTKRSAGLDLLLERLRNELTRLASVRAIELIAASTQDATDFSDNWVRDVALECAAQLRKASRVLRGASLSALRTLAINPASRQHIQGRTVEELMSALRPLVTGNDLHLLGPALVIISAFVKDNGSAVVNQNLIKDLCALVQGPVGGAALDALLALIRTIGEQGAGGALMGAMLKDVGVSGNPDVVGKVIGNLLVSGGATVGVKINNFVTELNNAKDDRRQCLALAVLGEAALRMGSSSPLQPQLFMSHFTSKSDKVPLAAAVALGRAGSGNIQVYLPVVLSAMGQPSGPQYLLLHSIKEILQHSGAEDEIIPYAQQLWQNLIAASQVEDNRAIGAECIGRLAIIDPKTYLPQLQAFLNDTSPGVRGMVISALRYTFADTDDSYDEVLRPIVVNMLTTMLNETDLENRRLALTTLNSAAHNKPDLIVPHLDQLLPMVMKETFVNPSLVREVQMGPFKHKADDGLEIRKSAYETLYALLDTVPSLPSTHPDFLDRTVAGLADEHDIRMLCLLMLEKLLPLAPDAVRARLEPLAEHFRAVLAFKPKENAVKQELERVGEAQRGVLKVSVRVNGVFGGGGAGAGGEGGGEGPGRAWGTYWEWVRGEFGVQLRSAVEEAREKER